MTILTDKNFNDFIAAGKKMVICTAGYCSLCIVAVERAKQLSQSQNIGTIELTAYECMATMRKLKIKKVPTLIEYRDGKELRRAEGTTALFKYLDQAGMSQNFLETHIQG